MKKASLHLTELRRFYRQHKRMPSYAEIARFCQYKSKRAAQKLADKWLELNLVKKDARGFLIPTKWFSPLRVLGSVQAGFPSPAEEEMTDVISLDDWLIGNRESSFILQVAGDSMIDAGIQPGDMVILERGREPKHGDIVVAEVDHDWTIKYFEKRSGKIILCPANKKYPNIIPEQELKIAGVVTAVMRKY